MRVREVLDKYVGTLREASVDEPKQYEGRIKYGGQCIHRHQHILQHIIQDKPTQTAEKLLEKFEGRKLYMEHHLKGLGERVGKIEGRLE